MSRRRRPWDPEPLANSYLYFGVAAHGKFTMPDSVIGYSVFIDGDGDDVPDYEIFSQRLGNRGDGIDIVLVLGAYLTGPNAGFLMETPDGNLAAEFLNIVPGNVDTNQFDNDTVIMPFPISSMPLLTRAGCRPGGGWTQEHPADPLAELDNSWPGSDGCCTRGDLSQRPIAKPNGPRTTHRFEARGLSHRL